MISAAVLGATLCSTLAPTTSWQAVEQVFRGFGKSVIFEFHAPIAASISGVTTKERAARLQTVARVLDRIPREREASLTLEATWLPEDHRLLDSLRHWSALQARATSGVRKRESGWEIKLAEGGTLSLRELQVKGVVQFDEAVPWFLDSRFIVRCHSASGEDLLTGIAACLGGTVLREGERKLIAIDPERFAKRRIRLAAEQVRRFPPPFPSGSFVTASEAAYVRSSIELAMLRGQKPSLIRELFSNPNHTLSIPTTERPDLLELVKAKLSMVRRAGGGKSFRLPETPTYFAELGGSGVAGGMVYLHNGTPWHF